MDEVEESIEDRNNAQFNRLDFVALHDTGCCETIRGSVLCGLIPGAI